MASRQFQLKTEYWSDLQARSAFKEFILEIHGLDFTEWETAGYWDDAYTPFSYFDGDSVVASVCIYMLDAIVNGAPTRVAQISGVGTLPQWRRQGLSRELTDLGLNWANGRHEGVFLFADTDAIPYYQRCGFRAIDEFVEVINATPTARRPGAVKLDPGQSEHLHRIYDHATVRTPISDTFCVLNAKLVMFHALYVLRDHVYAIPDLECIVMFERDGRCLRVFDIIGARIPTFEELYPYIAGADDQTIEFHFHPDRLEVSTTRRQTLVGNNPFVLDPFPFAFPVFPYTARA